MTELQERTLNQLKSEKIIHVMRKGSIQHKALKSLVKKGVARTLDNINYYLATTIYD